MDIKYIMEIKGIRILLKCIISNSLPTYCAKQPSLENSLEREAEKVHLHVEKLFSYGRRQNRNTK